MALVKIDAPGAGEWIMSRVKGTFTPGMDHSFSNHHDQGNILGGIVVGAYFGNSMVAHMAGDNSRWFTRELAWLAFDYCFNQVGCHKMIAGIRSDNHKAIAIDMRGGWQFETVIKDLYEPGVDMVVLAMTRDTCPWLNYRSKQFRSNVTAVTPGVN
jgi:hypothetical protein